jgi:hypothetical protein
MFEEDHGIKIVDNRRIYKMDLSKREFSYEFTSPYYLRLGNFVSKSTSYSNLLYELAKHLNDLSPKSKEELLSIRNDWGKQKVFSDKCLKNFKPFNYGVYINLNNTSIHAVWTIQLLIKEWNADISGSEFFIHKMPRAESKEVLEYYDEKTRQKLIEYIRFTRSFSEEKIENTIYGLNRINRVYCPEVFLKKGNDNIYEAETKYCYKKMKDDLFSYLNKKFYNNDIIRKHYKFCLNILGDFYQHYLQL